MAPRVAEPRSSTAAPVNPPNPRFRSIIQGLVEPFAQPLRYRRIFLQTLRDELRKRHAGSVFGAAWLVATPLLFLGLYAATYIWIFKVRPGAVSPPQYILFLFCGLMSFLAFAEALSAGSGAVAVNRAIMLNTVFPAELLPLRTVLAAHTLLIVGVVVGAVIALLLGEGSLYLLLTPVVVVAQVMYAAGIAGFLAPLHVLFKDLPEIIRFVILGLMIISPIAWMPEQAQGPLALLVYVNPLSYYIVGFQDLIVFRKLPGTGLAAIMVMQSTIFYVLGYWFTRRLKQVVGDYA